ncbi:MAG: LysR substrate-binding domain-containing protein [Pseudomonadota bacterium]
MSPSHRKLSLRGLRTFCTAAETLNYRRAADLLHVTPSAVSHQIKRLETELDVVLFNREGKKLSLSKDGQVLLDEIGPLLTQIDEATERFFARHQRPQLRVSVQPFFASEWFIPKLKDFTEKHPELDIFVDTSDESLAYHPANADASIRLFDRIPDSLDAVPLFPLRLVGACSAELKASLDPAEPSIDPNISLIVHNTRPDAWQIWHKQRGIRMQPAQRLVQLDSMIAVLRAAERGLGIALVPLPLAQQWFESGAVVHFGDDEVVTSDIYHFVSDPAASNAESVNILRDWVIEHCLEQ